jgi:hypothetical protein
VQNKAHQQAISRAPLQDAYGAAQARSAAVGLLTKK